MVFETENKQSPLSENERNCLIEGYKIIGDSLTDIARVCFRGNTAIIPHLKQHIEDHHEEFQGYLNNQADEFDKMLIRLQMFERINGHQHVQENEDRALSRWVNWQKHLLNRLQLPSANEERLTKIRFDFRDDADWETNLHGWDTRRTT